MSMNKLTIVPVKLDALPTESPISHSSHNTAAPSCIIKTAVAEISLFNGVDEHIIKTILKELKNL